MLVVGQDCTADVLQALGGAVGCSSSPEFHSLGFYSGNWGCAFLQIEVGRSSWPLDRPYLTLVPSVTLMTPADSKLDRNRCGVRMFKEGKVEPVLSERSSGEVAWGCPVALCPPTTPQQISWSWQRGRSGTACGSPAANPSVTAGSLGSASSACAHCWSLSCATPQW